MATNYYAFAPGITDPEGLHIGQAITGYRFLFHAHEHAALDTAAAWMKFLAQPGVAVRDDHENSVPVAELVEIATARKGADGRLLRTYGFRSALDAHPNWDQFLVDAEGYELLRRDFA